jgi:hypothetical protein
MITSASNQTEWDIWFDGVIDFWVGSDGSTIPIIPSLGNHEKPFLIYPENFALPGNEQWYS